MTRVVIALLFVLLMPPAGLARADTPEKRIALVIGNGAYRLLRPQLPNPTADARDIGRSLQDLGFETTIKANVTRRELYTLIDAFGAKIAGSPDTVGLFYYAGHGIQMDGRNYLVPVDADLQADSDLEAESVDAGKVLRAMDQARNRLNIVILDACRDNPLPKGRSLARGLASMDAPRGTFIAYAAAPGQSALDGEENGNGVFTGALIKQIRVPGLQIEDVFKRVIANVQERSGGKQVPWSESSLQGNFYFAVPAGAPTAGTLAQPQAASRSDRELAFWDSIKTSTDPADFVDFLKRYPESDFASVAKRRMDALNVVKATATPPVVDRQADVAPVAPIDTQEIVRGVQTELRRVGCYSGAIDGVWGPGTAAAVARFNQRTGKQLDPQIAKPESITAIRERADRVCPTPPVARRQAQPETVSREVAPAPSYQAPAYQSPYYGSPSYGGGQSYGRSGY